MKKTLISVLTIILAAVLCLAVSAETFSPSITVKEAPETHVIKNEGGKDIVGEYKDPTTGETKNIEAGAIVVTAYADRKEKNENVSAELQTKIEQNLESAHKEVTEAPNLGTLSKDLDNIAKKIDSSYDARVFSAVNLFEVTPSKLSEKDLENAKNLTLAFEVPEGTKAEELYVMYKDIETGKWTPLEIKSVAGAYVSVAFPGFGALLFMKPVASNMETIAPATGANSTTVLFSVLAIVSGAALSLIAFRKKENN